MSNLQRCSRTVNAIIGLVSALVVAACDSAGSPDEMVDELAPATAEFDSTVLASLPDDISPRTLEEGRALFPVCSVCHGDDARGTQLGPPLRGADWIHVDGGLEEIERLIRAGIPQPERYPVPMPEMGGGSFDDSELRALAGYVYALGRNAP